MMMQRKWYPVLVMALTALGCNTPQKSEETSGSNKPGAPSQVASVQVAAAAIEYWCPMHSQIVQDQAGRCPICQMSLVQRPKGGGPASPSSSDVAKDPYYCPMHPDKTSADPNAKCPVCAMKMEPRPKK